MKRIASVGFAAILLYATAASAADKYLPIDPNKIASMFDLKKIERLAAASRKEFASSNPDDFVWRANDDPRGIAIFVTGQGEKIYSLRIVVPVVNLSQKKNEEIFEKTGSLFSSLAPNWKDASNWPKTSLGASWKAVADGMANPPGNTGAFIPLNNH